ncbi:hypothetical protein CTAYLR_009762, partial [Chrysophaeum taylorii]
SSPSSPPPSPSRPQTFEESPIPPSPPPPAQTDSGAVALQPLPWESEESVDEAKERVIARILTASDAVTVLGARKSVTLEKAQALFRDLAWQFHGDKWRGQRTHEVMQRLNQALRMLRSYFGATPPPPVGSSCEAHSVSTSTVEAESGIDDYDDECEAESYASFCNHDADKNCEKKRRLKKKEEGECGGN